MEIKNRKNLFYHVLLNMRAKLKFFQQLNLSFKKISKFDIKICELYTNTVVLISNVKIVN